MCQVRQDIQVEVSGVQPPGNISIGFVLQAKLQVCEGIRAEDSAEGELC